MLVIKPDTKSCMAELLLKETFDSFTFIEGEITTFNKFHIDGYLQKQFYDSDDIPEAEYSHWKDIREFCFGIIKGKHTPLDFKFILALPAASIPGFLEQYQVAATAAEIQGLYLNFRYNGETLQCITGISLTTFRPDKTTEHGWDKYARSLFDQYHITYELME